MSSLDPVGDAQRMRASDADRERVAELLREAYVEGRLSPVEHEERLAGVYRATTYGELAPLVADLPVPPGTLAVPPPAQVVPTAAPGARGAVVVDPSRAGQGQGAAVAILSGVERKGRWVVPPTVTAVAVMGGIELDLTDAILTATSTTITVICSWVASSSRSPRASTCGSTSSHCSVVTRGRRPPRPRARPCCA